MTAERTYPDGVPCWIDLEAPDPEAASAFYRGLLGWELADVVPEHVPDSYLVATLGDGPIAAIAPGEGDARWTTYVAVDDAAAGAERVAGAGGRVLGDPEPIGPPGTLVNVEDAAGAAFRLWQPGKRTGAQHVNAPGTWTFSNLRTADVDAAEAFYGSAFGWRVDRFDDTGAWRKPGYGAHLAATSDPGILERQAGAPDGFEDVVAALEPAGDGPPRWHVVLGVADRDEAAATAERLGATIVSRADGQWTRTAEIRDPQGAALTLSQFAPPDSF